MGNILKSLNLLDFLDLEIKDSQRIEICKKNTVKTPEISIPEIFQLNKQIMNNQIYVNIRTNNYIISFPYTVNSLENPPEILFSEEKFKESMIISKNYYS